MSNGDVHTQHSHAHGATKDEPRVILDMRDVTVQFRVRDGVVHAVEDLTLSVNAGEVVAIVGESGSGKSVAMLAAMQLLRGKAVRVTGDIRFKGRTLAHLSASEVQTLRGNELSIVFQNAMTALTPVRTIGWQLAEAIRVHRRMERQALREACVDLLRRVGLPDPSTRLDDYPHQFSGGMRQRVMIAMALANDPDLIIADEPTTALDVTVQAQILRLLKRLNVDMGAAVMVVTHDMGVVAEIADRVVVMYGGRVMEAGPVVEVLEAPRHPYTEALLAAIPRLDRPRIDRLAAIPGQPSDGLHRTLGCAFHPRCAHVRDACKAGAPEMVTLESGRQHSCLRSAEIFDPRVAP